MPQNAFQWIDEIMPSLQSPNSTGLRKKSREGKSGMGKGSEPGKGRSEPTRTAVVRGYDLAVEPQQVVSGQAESADWRL